MSLTDKVVLVTGGTGSFGRRFAETLLRTGKPRKVIVFSRDELKQSEMHRALDNATMRYFIGDATLHELAGMEIVWSRGTTSGSFGSSVG